MYLIDSGSTMIIGGIGALLAAAMLAHTRPDSENVRRGCQRIAIGELLIGLGMFSFLFAPAMPPNLPFMLVAAGVMAGCMAWGFGFRAMTGRPPMARPLQIGQFALLGLMPVAALFGRSVLEVYFPAALAMSMLLFYVDMYTVIGSYHHRIAVGLHVVLGSLIASWLLRSIGAWLHEGPIDPIGLYLPWGGEQLLLAAYGIAPLLVAVQVMLLVNVQLARNLRQQAYIDALTGVSSRRGLTEAWPGFERRTRESGRLVAVALFDLDRFKRVNDTYGHLVGDDALCHVVNVAQPVLRPGDHFSRYGGEEFLLLLSVADQRDAAIVGERVRAAIESSPCRCGKLELSLTVSVGIAMVEVDESMSAAIARADRRLYAAKAQGRNCVIDHEVPA